jgi:hypothetical protein
MLPELAPRADGPYFELCFRPTVTTITTARRFVASLYATILGDADVASRIALAAHEMLENGLKYSVDGETSLRVSLSRVRGTRTLRVETKNRVSDDDREALEDVFAEMRRVADRDAYYQFTLHRARARRRGSGLGLARIWAEAEMELEHFYDDGFSTILAAATIPQVTS